MVSYSKYTGAIVLCLILDSRQNFLYHLTVNDLIVLCLILDSRQNFALP